MWSPRCVRAHLFVPLVLPPLCALRVLDQKLMPFGMEHNFWRADQSSGAGLCGPSTEVHVDFDALVGGDAAAAGGGADGAAALRCSRCLINTTSPQVVELWNCVFITHRRTHAGPAESPLAPLPRQFVDTGMGLERLACVMQVCTVLH